MDKSLYSKIKIEDAGEICRRIIEDASSQANNILANAKKEASNILNEARQEADNRKKDILKRHELEVGQIKQKIFSTINLEKKRLSLEEKSEFIDIIFEKVKVMAMEFRKNPGYRGFMEKAICEGIEVVGASEADVLYSTIDEKLINEDIIKNIKGAALNFKKSGFKDIGVIVQSRDGSRIYDNTFSARFKRLHDEIYMDLLKGEF